MTVTINGTTGVAGVDGTASTPAIQGNDTNTGIFFPAADTIAFAEGGAEVARFDSNGNLGIGVTSPTQKLDVSGLVQSQNNAGSNDSVVGAYNFYNTNASASANPNRASIVAGRENSAWGAYLQFNTSTGTSAVAERMRIDSSGTFYIGKTSTANDINTQGFFCRPWGKMVSTTLDSAEQNFVASHASASGTVVSVQFFYNGSSVGTITKTASSTAYNTSSDYRLKDNIAPMTGALAKVQALKPCTYTWKATGEADEGFIAHELAEVCPSAVTGEKDAVNEDGSIKAQGIDTSFLVATLTAAIQELNAKVDSLQAELATLKGQA